MKKLKKLSDFEDGEQRRISEGIEAVASSLGHDTWEANDPTYKYSELEELLGICASCKSLECCSTEFGRVFAKCGYMNIRLHGKDKMVECTNLSPRGQMSIVDMKEIAIYIDVEKEKDIGFIRKKKE